MSNVINLNDYSGCGHQPQSPCCDNTNFIRYTYNTGDAPASLPGISNINIEVGPQPGPLNIATILPTDLDKGTRVVIRKMNTDPFVLTYDDGFYNYTFQDIQGDYLVLVWAGDEFRI